MIIEDGSRLTISSSEGELLYFFIEVQCCLKGFKCEPWLIN